MPMHAINHTRTLQSSIKQDMQHAHKLIIKQTRRNEKRKKKQTFKSMQQE